MIKLSNFQEIMSKTSKNEFESISKMHDQISQF